MAQLTFGLWIGQDPLNRVADEILHRLNQVVERDPGKFSLQMRVLSQMSAR